MILLRSSLSSRFTTQVGLQLIFEWEVVNRMSMTFWRHNDSAQDFANIQKTKGLFHSWSIYIKVMLPVIIKKIWKQTQKSVTIWAWMNTQQPHYKTHNLHLAQITGTKTHGLHIPLQEQQAHAILLHSFLNLLFLPIPRGGCINQESLHLLLLHCTSNAQRERRSVIKLGMKSNVQIPVYIV